MARIALLHNPEAGSGDGETIAGALRAAGAEVVALPCDRIDAALGAKPDRLAVAGGDGSIGPVAEAAGRAGVPLAVIPAGTANDFARALGIPDDPADAAMLAARGARTRRLELGRMGARPFVNVASVGLSPVAARKAHGMKRLFGSAAYALGALRAAIGARPVRCRVSCDGAETFAGDAWQVMVACSGAFGGGATVGGDPRDGLLDAVAIEAGSRLALARRAQGMRSGRIRSQRGVHSARGHVVELEVADGTPFNVDGELLEAGSIRFEVEPAAFELIVG